MSFSVPLQIAETIQTASINRAPSPSHDINPSTAASSKEPVSVEKYAYDEDGIDEDEDEEDIPYSVLGPVPRRQSFGPLPDLRFEQSYLASIAGAETYSRVAYITIRDQASIFIWSPLALLTECLAIPSACTRHGMVTSSPRMAILEPECPTAWKLNGSKITEVVVPNK
jgi:hypothetical protein